MLERGDQPIRRHPHLVVADFSDLSTERSIRVGRVYRPAFRFSLHFSPHTYPVTAAALNVLI